MKKLLLILLCVPLLASWKNNKKKTKSKYTPCYWKKFTDYYDKVPIGVQWIKLFK